MTLDLLDWRRRVAGLYAEVRSSTDPRAAHAAWRATRNELLATHPQSPVPPDRRIGFSAPVADYDPDLRFEAELDTDVAELRLAVETGTDGIVPLERLGRLHLPDVGDLDVWWIGGYGGGVFVPIKDATSGITTYGGGRYVLDTAKGADLGGAASTLLIDLNFAYNPSCAYDPAWACPLAPAGNVVPVRVEAGELSPPAPPAPDPK